MPSGPTNRAAEAVARRIEVEPLTGHAVEAVQVRLLRVDETGVHVGIGHHDGSGGNVQQAEAVIGRQRVAGIAQPQRVIAGSGQHNRSAVAPGRLREEQVVARVEQFDHGIVAVGLLAVVKQKHAGGAGEQDVVLRQRGQIARLQHAKWAGGRHGRIADVGDCKAVADRRGRVVAAQQ